METVTDSTLTILRRITCGGIRQTEDELRHQLRRDGHPLAEAPGLLVELAKLERDRLIETHMNFILTPKGKEVIRGSE